ncbi:type II toxin-antitoxin system prevent-host-death family antitoxin [Acidobacteria bacterium AH-259-O06]|nr:type II toxin-antitoxin system prevent-host-death family antitoxin [Acidobacteria bacterium AH-259-O06]
MFDMKTATVRQVQHHLSEVLRWIEEGEEVLVTKRNRVVAKIVPARDKTQTVKWPDFVTRSSRIWGKGVRGKSVSRIIIEEREERH